MSSGTRLFNFKPRRVRTKVFARTPSTSAWSYPSRQYFDLSMVDEPIRRGTPLSANHPAVLSRPDPSSALLQVRATVTKFWQENYLRIRRVITRLLTAQGYTRISFRTLAGTLKLIRNARVGGFTQDGDDLSQAAAWNRSYLSHTRPAAAARREALGQGRGVEEIYLAGSLRGTVREAEHSIIHELLHNFARVRGRVLGSPLDHRVMHALGERGQPDMCDRYGFQRPTRTCPVLP